jgi:hypothetical protein
VDKLSQVGNKQLLPAEANHILSMVFRQFRKLFICIDALDEYKERGLVSLLGALLKLLDHPSYGSVFMFITGRPHMERHVKQHLVAGLKSSISIKPRANANDIEKFLRHQINSDVSDVKMSSAAANEIVTQISKTADGM